MSWKYRNLGNEVSPERYMACYTKEPKYRNLGNEVSPERIPFLGVLRFQYRNLGNEVSPEQRGRMPHALQNIET